MRNKLIIAIVIVGLTGIVALVNLRSIESMPLKDVANQNYPGSFFDNLTTEHGYELYESNEETITYSKVGIETAVFAFSTLEMPCEAYYLITNDEESAANDVFMLQVATSDYVVTIRNQEDEKNQLKIVVDSYIIDPLDQNRFESIEFTYSLKSRKLSLIDETASETFDTSILKDYINQYLEELEVIFE